MGKDYYKILGVEKTAGKEEIKRVFRKLAHEHHPDKGGDAEKFKEINEAYQVLSDDAKRQQYDQFGTTFDGAGQGGFGGFNFGEGFGGQGFDFSDLGDLFGDFFGASGSRRGRSAKGRDIQIDIQLTFKEAVFGVEKEIQITKNNTCERCGGLGAEPGTQMDSCSVCNGSGVVEKIQHTILGAIKSRTACENCSGKGQVPKNPCTTCHGQGVEYKKKSLRVNVPSGVDDGMKIRVRGEGESIGAVGSPGDLYVSIHVKPDSRFERVGDIIYSEQKIGFTQAALGDEIKIETVDGVVKLKIPAGTQSGEKLRLRGKGVPKSHGRGDHIVIVNVVTPKNLSRKEKKILEELNLREE